MPAYKLTYFNGRGRAEVTRFLFALVDVKYEDNRIESEAWGAMKPDTLFGGLPELEIDGDFKLCQSDSISRYLAEEFGLMGKTNKDAAFIDMLMGCMVDIYIGHFEYVFEKDEDRKKQLGEDFKQKLTGWLSHLEKLLSKNKGGDGWFVGDAPTLADVAVYYCLTVVQSERGFPDALKDSPKLSAHAKRFEQLPRIAAWIKKRPESSF